MKQCAAYMAAAVPRPLCQWKNSLLLFFTTMETVADPANEALRTHQPIKQHLLDIRAEAVEPPPASLLTQEHANLTREPYLQ